jgi:hypothetical protein
MRIDAFSHIEDAHSQETHTLLLVGIETLMEWCPRIR